jgi:hypothetical protein
MYYVGVHTKVREARRTHFVARPWRAAVSKGHEMSLEWTIHMKSSDLSDFFIAPQCLVNSNDIFDSLYCQPRQPV